MADDMGSITVLIRDLNNGDRDAVGPLWDRYFEKLSRLARRKLEAAGGRGAINDDEDVALSVLGNLCAGIERGRYPSLADRDGLWRLLMRMTADRVIDERRRSLRLKNGGGRVRNEADLAAVPGDDYGRLLEEVLGREPAPEFVAMMDEQCERLLDLLPDDRYRLRQIAERKLDGLSNREISRELGCSVRTIDLRLALIRKTWMSAQESRER